MTSTTGRRRTVLAFAVAVALTGVVACGSPEPGEGGGDDPFAALKLADRSTGDADSSRIESTGDMGDLMSFEANGEVDWADGLNGRLTITYTGGQAADRMGGSASPRRRPAICPTPTTRTWATSSPDSTAASGGSGTRTRTWTR